MVRITAGQNTLLLRAARAKLAARSPNRCYGCGYANEEYDCGLCDRCYIDWLIYSRCAPPASGETSGVAFVIPPAESRKRPKYPKDDDPLLDAGNLPSQIRSRSRPPLDDAGEYSSSWSSAVRAYEQEFATT